MISTKDFEHKQILFVLLEEGEKVSFKNDNIIILNKEGKINTSQPAIFFLRCLFQVIFVLQADFWNVQKNSVFQ